LRGKKTVRTGEARRKKLPKRKGGYIVRNGPDNHDALVKRPVTFEGGYSGVLKMGRVQSRLKRTIRSLQTAVRGWVDKKSEQLTDNS